MRYVLYKTVVNIAQQLSYNMIKATNAAVNSNNATDFEKLTIYSTNIGDFS
jgi:hypothetical protein